MSFERLCAIIHSYPCDCGDQGSSTSTCAATFEAAAYVLQEKQTERMQQLEKRLRQPDYADKTPSDVQQKDAEKLQKYQTELAAVIDQIAQSRKFLSS